jgi:predicted lipid-binding transport protein (Tim44 family)
MSTAQTAELDYAEAAAAAARDAATRDARFDPAFLAASVRRVIAAWAAAASGQDDSPLAALAEPGALQTVLHPADLGDPVAESQLMIGDLRIAAITVTGVDAGASPPWLQIAFRCRGQRYVRDLVTGTVLSGDRTAPGQFTELWRLALDGAQPWPWRLAAARTITDAAGGPR